MLQPTHLCDLLVEPGAHPRGQAHLSAASGLVRVGGRLYLVADDEHHLGILAADGVGAVQMHRVLDGDLPADKGKRKKHKPDLEAMALLPPEAGMAHGALLALGSGSRPNRQQALLVALDGGGLPCATPVACDFAALYLPLRDQFPDLNIEGAFVAGPRLRLLQRGNKGDARNACIDYSLAQLRAWMTQGGEAPMPRNIREFSLGGAGGVPLGFTDGTALPGGAWLFSAVAEDTGDSYNDGACGASAIGWVTEGGTLQRLEHVAGAPKIEGITLADDGRLLVVTDSDDPATPSALLSLNLS
jgi:hypothetical protein